MEIHLENENVLKTNQILNVRFDGILNYTVLHKLVQFINVSQSRKLITVNFCSSEHCNYESIKSCNCFSP